MFNQYFEVFLADTVESKRIHYSIRYQVYCEEMGYENKDNYPLKMEYDENDRISTHFIVRDKRTGLWVGAMRLIFQSDGGLPIEQRCLLDEKIGNNSCSDAVELSRLCLIKDVRSGVRGVDYYNEDTHRASIPLLNSHKAISNPHRNKYNRLIIWGLIYAATEYCSKHNIHHWYFMTSSALAKVLTRGGLNLMGIGEPCLHKGQRFPFKMNVIETYDSDIWTDFQYSYKHFSKWCSKQFLSIASVA